MVSSVSAIWGIADEMRGRGERLDLANLVRSAKEAGITVGVREFVSIMQRLGSRAGDYCLPTDVAEFVAGILEPAAPKSVLDSWAGTGLLAIPVCACLHPEDCVALSRNAAACEVFGMLEGSAGIDIQCTDPLHALAESTYSYDAIVANAPFAMRGPESLIINLGGKDLEINDDYGYLLILQSCLRLAENGIGVFIVPNSFFFASGRSGKARHTLEELGFRISAAVELPAGTFHPLTALTTHIIVVQKSSDTTLFTGRFAPDIKQQQELLKNLAARSRAKSPSLGRLVPSDSFRGFSAIELGERVQEQARRMGLVPYRFDKVVLELNTPSSSSDVDGFLEKPNALYLPQMAATSATTLQGSLPDRLKSYVQIVLDPEVADAEFLAGLLNTQFGQMWRDSLRTGETIPRISKRLLKEATFYLPPAGSKKIQNAVVDCYRAISGLKSELNEIEATLWTRPANIDKIRASLEMVNREDRYEHWLDTLPFPLASILWVCHTQGGNHRDQYERKLQFFEAFSEFLAVVHLSAFHGSPALWPSLNDKVTEVLAKQRVSSLETATFGTWKTYVEILSAETRHLLNDEKDMCFELYKTRNQALIRSIASKRLVHVIQDANSLRNDWVGHTGVVRDADARAVNERLLEHIATVRDVFGVCWKDFELLLPGEECRRTGDIYSQAARKVMGSRTPFPAEKVELFEDMEAGHLYLKSPDEQRALKLLPLVKVMPSPRTQENACYFYNRQRKDGIRFLSYYFEPDSEVVQEFADAAEALRRLTQV